ncbi:MAG: adenine deaminase C-terminal domain-containing protein, partial [Mailhella sp.]
RNAGLLKLAVLERHHATGKIGVGLLDGRYGLKNGAIATTIAHDSHNIVVAGDNDDDMVKAVQEVEKLQGGIVMVSGSKLLAALPLPVGGLMSEHPASEVASELEKLLRLADEHYHIWEGADAFMTLSFLALPVIPRLKLTARGLFDVEKFSFVDVDAGK